MAAKKTVTVVAQARVGAHRPGDTITVARTEQMERLIETGHYRVATKEEAQNAATEDPDAGPEEPGRAD